MAFEGVDLEKRNCEKSARMPLSKYPHLWVKLRLNIGDMRSGREG